jgi:hypothetical protein
LVEAYMPSNCTPARKDAGRRQQKEAGASRSKNFGMRFTQNIVATFFKRSRREPIGEEIAKSRERRPESREQQAEISEQQAGSIKGA